MPLHLRVGRAPASGVAFGPKATRDVAGATRSDRSGTPPRTPAACRRTGVTHAHGGQTRDRRRAARGTRQRPDDDRLRVPRPQGQGDRRDPARPAQAGRDVSRRQEPADAHRRRGFGRRRPSARCSPDRPRSRSAPTRPGTAKAVLDATRPYARVVRITGGVLGDRAIGGDDVIRLAALPSREVLLAKLAGGMQAPVGTLAGLFAAPLRNLGYALQQVADQKAQANP